MTDTFDADTTGLDAGATPEAGETAKPDDPSAKLPALHILVAEDYRLNQKVISAMLTDLGHRVSVVNNGMEAVSAVLRLRYDLILMDVHIPELDGKAAARRIRALPRPEGDIPIIALTADASMDQQKQCLAAGMDFYLTKPIILPDLQQAMAKCVLRAKTPEKVSVVQPAIGQLEPDFEDEPSEIPIVDVDVLVEFAEMVGWDSVATLFETLTKDFIEHRRIITRAAESGEIEVLRRQTQALNGALGQFGATKAQETAHVIETLCKAGYSETACDMIPKFLQLGQDSILVLQKCLETMARPQGQGMPSPSFSI
ncbi:MAG: response regulator [Alphaproteobacteria bacterium]